MLSNTIDKGKSKLDKANEYLHEIFKEYAIGNEEEDKEIDKDGVEIIRGEYEAIEIINKVKKKRRRLKKNQGKAKDTCCEADEGNTEFEEVEDEFQLPEEFPFRRVFLLCPESSR